jgi:Domain of unknown function (DUF4037)
MSGNVRRAGLPLTAPTLSMEGVGPRLSRAPGAPGDGVREDVPASEVARHRLVDAMILGVTEPGARLAEHFFTSEVRTVVERAVPGLKYLAGRLGSGSEVLGFDDERSRDHDFGCRLTLLVDDVDEAKIGGIDDHLERELPATFLGQPTRFPTTWDSRHRHKVEVSTVHAFAESRLGVDVTVEFGPEDWLSIPGQAILEVTGGPVFHDTTRDYGALAARLRWYPPGIWHYVLASSWARLAQELPLVGRTAERGDDLGSRLVTARLAGELVHLAFLLDQRWAPYAKWVGSALRQLPIGALLVPPLAAAAAATSWADRERGLCLAAESLGRRQAELGLPVVGAVTQPFFDRPFQTVNPAIHQSLMNLIADPQVSGLPVGVGSIEQWCDNVDLMAHPERRSAIQSLYRQILLSMAKRPSTRD